MADKAKVRFEVYYGRGSARACPTVQLACSCDKQEWFSRLPGKKGRSWIVECPACHRRYQVGVIEVEAL
jgi:hypothetical protein